MAVAEPVARIAQEGKFLTFRLGSQDYGLEILKVREINSLTGVTRVPHTPDYVRGVINLRGRVIPILSLRRRLRLPTVPDTDKTCVIVVQAAYRETEVALGLIVDEVSEVLHIPADRINDAPGLAGGLQATDYVAGLGRCDNRVVVLLDIDAILDGDELEAVVRTTGRTPDAPGRRQSYVPEETKVEP